MIECSTLCLVRTALTSSSFVNEHVLKDNDNGNLLYNLTDVSYTEDNIRPQRIQNLHNEAIVSCYLSCPAFLSPAFSCLAFSPLAISLVRHFHVLRFSSLSYRSTNIDQHRNSQCLQTASVRLEIHIGAKSVLNLPLNTDTDCEYVIKWSTYFFVANIL